MAHRRPSPPWRIRRSGVLSRTVHRMSDRDPVISFLSDYGLQDEFVGVCHGVIAKRCPRARVIDVTHEIPPQDVLVGARALRDTVPFMPAGVHLAVVDPGVGATGVMQRRAVALRVGEDKRWLVGPDNGLLVPAAIELGGVAIAMDIGASPECLTPVSPTFHGRDVFAPVAAAIADGAPLDSIGEPFDPEELKDVLLPEAEFVEAELQAHVVAVDRFGNLALDATGEQLEHLGVEPGAEATIEADCVYGTATRGRTFADVPPGSLLLYEDARGMVALAVNEGSAEQSLGLSLGDRVTLQDR